MSKPYPWLTDSKNGTTPLVTDYLEVTAPNGLYLNSTNSQVLLKNPATSEKLTLNKSSIDFINSGGNSSVLINNTKIHLNEQTPTTTPLTTDITNQNIILQSLNYTTPFTQTLTLSPSFIQHLTPNNSMLIGNGSYATTSLGVNYTSTLNATECRLGYDGVSNNGDLYCRDITCRDITCSLINGYAPTTTGLIWSDFNNAYPNLLNGRYYLTDTTYETYQDVQQFYARNMSSNQSASYNWNGINTQNGTFTLQTNGYNFDLNCATFNINGTPYSPGGGGGSQDLSNVLGIGNNASGQNITGVADISVSTINGQPYPPYPTSPYGLPNVLAIDNNAGGANITGVADISVSTINGSSYPPSISIPQTAYAMPFQSGNISNGSQKIFPSGVTIQGGYSYSVVWTFWYDGLVHGGGTSEMIQGYADLYSSASGSISGSARLSSMWASATISSNNMYRTTITYTDNYYISFTDTYYPNVLQLNSLTPPWDGNTYLSAVITRTS
jgi:hypothetical protein